MIIIFLFNNINLLNIKINKNQENILDNNKIMNKCEKSKNKKNSKIIIYNNKENQINIKNENNKKNNKVILILLSI